MSNNPTYRNVKPESKAREDQQRQHAIEGRASFAADPREVAHLSTHSKTDPKLGFHCENGGGLDEQASFHCHLTHLCDRERVPQIPAHAPQDNVTRIMSPLEWIGCGDRHVSR